MFVWLLFFFFTPFLMLTGAIFHESSRFEVMETYSTGCIKLNSRGVDGVLGIVGSL